MAVGRRGFIVYLIETVRALTKIGGRGPSPRVCPIGGLDVELDNGVVGLGGESGSVDGIPGLAVSMHAVIDHGQHLKSARVECGNTVVERDSNG